MRSLALITMFAPILGFGQIAVTESDFANAGDTVRMSSTTDLGIDFSSTGANWTWDYSMLVPEDQTLLDFTDISNASMLVNFVYGQFAGTDYQANYYIASDDLPLDQVGGFLPVEITDIVQFSKVSSSAITSLGFAISVEGTEVPFKSDTIEMRYEFPLMYQNVYSSRGYTNMDLNPIQDIIWRQYRTRDSEVDGWGSITTPYGTFDAIRVKHAITEIDSISIDLFGGPMWIPLPIPDSYIYEWWTNGEKEPILRIETSLFGGTETVSNIEYRDNYNAALAGIEEVSIDVEIYPNPVTDELRVNGLDPNTSYTIVSTSGAIVNQGVLEAAGTISVDDLSPGSYSLILLSNGKLAQTSFIKQ